MRFAKDLPGICLRFGRDLTDIQVKIVCWVRYNLYLAVSWLTFAQKFPDIRMRWFIDKTLGTYFRFAGSTLSPVVRIMMLAGLLVFPQRKVKLKVSSPIKSRIETWFKE